MVCRAVHLEWVPDLTTKSFLDALKNLMFKYGPPKILVSDNVTTFTAGDKILQEIKNRSSTQDALRKGGIEWTFIPVKAPWVGSVFERLIQFMKQNMKKMLGSMTVTIFELYTCLKQIEGIINQRPLTKVGEDEIVTPNMLLVGRQNSTDLNILHTEKSSELLEEALEVRDMLPVMYKEIERKED